MNVTDGITLAKSLRKALPKCQIIFLTSSREHAVAAFEVGAAHYIEKPIDKKSFECAMDRAVSALAKAPIECLICRTDRGVIEKVPFSAIITAESCIREQKLLLTDGQNPAPARNPILDLRKTQRKQSIYVAAPLVHNQHALCRSDKLKLRHIV